MTIREKIQKLMDDYTREALSKDNPDKAGIDTLYVAQKIGIDRTNASKELNRLWRSGQLIKLQGHPMLYLSRTVLTNGFCKDNLPNVLFKDDKLSNYMNPARPVKKPNDHELDIDRIVGSNGSLHDQIRDAKAAILYPPYGLSLLMIGNPGVNKMRIAAGLHQYAQQMGVKPENARFIRMECASYATDEGAEVFLNELFGSQKDATKGYLTTCAHGTVYLNGIHALPPRAKNAVTDLIQRGTYMRTGTSSPAPLTCTIIASIPPSQQEDIAYFEKFFALKIELPDIDKRGMYEKIEELLSLFESEAVRIKRTIRLSKDILALFAEMPYSENLLQMRAEVRQACARAYMASSPDLSTIFVSYEHLSLQMLSMHESSRPAAAVESVLSLVDTDYILFEPDGTCTTLRILRELPSRMDVVRFDQFLDRLDTDTASVNDVSDFISDNISILVNCGNAEFTRIQNATNPLVSQIFHTVLEGTPFADILHHNPRLLQGLIFHLSTVITKLLNNENTEPAKQASYPPQMFAQASACARQLTERLETVFHVRIPAAETNFTALYLKIAEEWHQRQRVPLLIIAHGTSIATQLKDSLQARWGSELPVSAIDYAPNMQLNDLLELVLIDCGKIDQGEGILLAVDGEPLNSLPEYVSGRLHIRCRAVTSFSLKDLDRLAQAILSDHSLDQIMLEQPRRETGPDPAKTNRNPSILYRLTNEILQPSLTFLYADKAVDALMISLSNILDAIHKPYSNRIAMLFVSHSVNMIERVIRNEPLHYPKAASFIKANREVYQTVEANMRNINELYGIVVPKEELAYITEIILDYQKEA